MFTPLRSIAHLGLRPATCPVGCGGLAYEPWEHRYLGQERFPDALSAMEVEHFFTLGEEELVAVRRRRTVLNRLALALQISFLKMTGGTLNSVEIIPTEVLEHLGRQLRCAPPRIASIRVLYRRRRTLFEHQAAALHTLGRIEPSEHAKRGLVAYLRREAAAVFDNAELMAHSRSWLVDHGYLLLREREIRRRVGAARRHQEQALFKTIAAVVGVCRLPQRFAIHRPQLAAQCLPLHRVLLRDLRGASLSCLECSLHLGPQRVPCWLLAPGGLGLGGSRLPLHRWPSRFHRELVPRRPRDGCGLGLEDRQTRGRGEGAAHVAAPIDSTGLWSDARALSNARSSSGKSVVGACRPLWRTPAIVSFLNP
jgi:hypothetical protein